MNFCIHVHMLMMSPSARLCVNGIYDVVETSDEPDGSSDSRTGDRRAQPDVHQS